MKAIVSKNNSRIKGSKSQIFPNISHARTRIFDIILKERLAIKLKDLSDDQMLKGRSNIIVYKENYVQGINLEVDTEIIHLHKPGCEYSK